MDRKDCFASFHNANYKSRVTGLHEKVHSGERGLLDDNMEN